MTVQRRVFSTCLGVSLSIIVVQLRSNRLTSVPSSIGKLVQLEELWVSEMSESTNRMLASEMYFLRLTVTVFNRSTNVRHLSIISYSLLAVGR